MINSYFAHECFHFQSSKVHCVDEKFHPITVKKYIYYIMDCETFIKLRFHELQNCGSLFNYLHARFTDVCCIGIFEILNTYSTAEILCDRAANTEKSLKSAPFDML